jgi:ribosomal protein S18 acetylase RimI-like enzyme
MSARESIEIRPACPADARILSYLMSKEIYWGRLPELGQSFLNLLHRHMIASKFSISYVATQGLEIVGYILGVTDTSKFYREFLFRYGVLASIVILPKIFRMRHFTTILRGLTYFQRRYPEDPKAEMLAFAVNSGNKLSGVGKALFETIIDQFKAYGVTKIKFGTVDTNNKAANNFYLRIGCELVRTVKFYKDSHVNVYIYNIS